VEPIDPSLGAPPTWHDASVVDGYLHRVHDLAPRQAGEEVLCSLLPSRPATVLDLGCGDGRLARMVLDARPSIERIVAVDSSPPMLAKARGAFADDPRVMVTAWDLNRSIAPLGPFDVIVSGFAIHHLDDGRKRNLLVEIADQLRTGGLFANLEVVASATPELHAEFQALIGRPADDPEDRLVGVEQQLAWMRESGMEQVDCFWRWRGFALLAGRGRETVCP
jgi:tRNA (cmo5U34)-methyltransferase